MRARLRPAYTPDELAKMYAEPHKHDLWPDHVDRVAKTIRFVEDCFGGEFETAADLSCGDAAIISALNVDLSYLGDIAPGYRFVGPIEQTILKLPPVELFVCTETLEHVDDPAKLLKLIRTRAERLILSTPVDAWNDENPEHYWAWDEAGVDELLEEAGFAVVGRSACDWSATGPSFYRFGMWGCL